MYNFFWHPLYISQYTVYSVLATGWAIRGSNPGGGEIFLTRPDRPWGPPSPLYNGYWVFSGGRKRPGRGADSSPLLVPRSKNRVPVLSLRAFVACKNCETYLPKQYTVWIFNATRMNHLNIKGEMFVIVSEDTCGLIIDCFAVKITTLQSFETLVHIYQSTWRNVAGDLSL
jgi:hypothetical protein